MDAPEPILFSLSKIITDEFAIIQTTSPVGISYQVSPNIKFGFSKEDYSILVNAKFNFMSGNDIALVTAVTCIFKIEETSWRKIYNPDNGILILPQHAAIHFASLVIGTARGVIHSKTELTPFNIIMLPPINLQEGIKQDIEMKNN